MYILYKYNLFHNNFKNSCTYCTSAMPFITLYRTRWVSSLIHAGEKPYDCWYCDKLESFQKIVRWRNILSIHEGNKAFECETCDKSFSKKANMKEHIPSIHEGMKSFKIVRWRNICYQFMKEIRNSNVNHVTKVICGLKLTPHFTLFDPANMIPTLGNRGLPNSAML